MGSGIMSMSDVALCSALRDTRDGEEPCIDAEVWWPL